MRRWKLLQSVLNTDNSQTLRNYFLCLCRIVLGNARFSWKQFDCFVTKKIWQIIRLPGKLLMKNTLPPDPKFLSERQKEQKTEQDEKGQVFYESVAVFCFHLFFSSPLWCIVLRPHCSKVQTIERVGRPACLPTRLSVLTRLTFHNFRDA